MARQTRKKVAPAGAATQPVEETKVTGVTTEAADPAPSADPGEQVASSEASDSVAPTEATDPVSSAETDQDADSVEPADAVETTEAADQSPATADLADAAPAAVVETTETPAQAGAFPGQYRVTNNTRMALSLPIVDAQIAASSSTDVAIRDEAQMQALRIELDALAALNQFGKDAFVIAPQDAQ